MFKRINQYLLTHYPLLWNMRVAGVAASLFVIHLFYFLAGITSIDRTTISRQYGLRSLIDGSLFTFSVLCSIAVLVIWLIYYLRNNAFKNFYIIDRWHTAKEFVIAFLLLLFSIVFVESYKAGVWLKVRSITSQQELVREANIMNMAASFIPVSRNDYFKLNSCYDIPSSINYNEDYDYFDSTNVSYNDTSNIRVRAALKETDAFSYKNYCENFITLNEYPGFIPNRQWRQTRNRWIDRHQTDSIRWVLDQAMAISQKYNIQQGVEPQELTRLVFADSTGAVTRIYNSYNKTPSEPPHDFFEVGDIRRALSMVDDCYLGSSDSFEKGGSWLIELYIALCLAILLINYRLFSRKVFLISILGSVVWLILFSLFTAYSGSVTEGAWFFLVLFIAFIAVSIGNRSGGYKTANGTLLNWHSYMVPFVMMLVVMLINNDYESHIYKYHYPNRPSDEVLQREYPIGYWVDHHHTLLFWLNLLFVFLYCTFIYTRMAKKWHSMPEE